ncbi:MAG: hypothetical protein NC925_00535 [Candidatus Omnitrophica bacterium]|nr:hypothetical protein [Candidatus Omnitrophota bacterium]MCM8832144.1 hypothetical protein [Candidatus Omnitrophota bacterium]
MKGLSIVFLVIGLIGLVLSIYSRFSMQLLPLAPAGVNASGLLGFSNTCFLLSIIFKIFSKE